MKILMVAIPNHHFFRWTQQLEQSGHEVYWFDITDSGPNSSQIKWVNQLKGWKQKWNYPFRTTLKKRLPRLFKFIQKFNERDINSVFQNYINEISPDVIHCFEMKLSGMPILNTLNLNKDIPLVYSSWGSDLFAFDKLGLGRQQVTSFLERTNYLITDCKRDFEIAKINGFENNFLGVFPGNGGLKINFEYINSFKERNTIIIKGYDDGVGKAIKVLKALELLPKELIAKYKVVIYSADADSNVEDYVGSSSYFNSIDLKIYSRYQFLQNEKLLKLMGQSVIHIANSISDGMPNALLEAMSMGSFPIQSNPGNVTEEIINNNENGLLIINPLDEKEIANHIQRALMDIDLRENAYNYNINFMNKYYNRITLQSKIEQLYASIID